MHRMRFTLLAVALATLALAGWLSGCGKNDAGNATTAAQSAEKLPQAAESTRVAPTTATQAIPQPPKAPDPIVVLHTTAGDIQLHLFADQAPQTVNNFLSAYANQGFYDNTIFHHVETGSMLIGGGFTPSLEPKPGRTPIYNESRNGLSNHRGTVAMIREPDSPHTATSQFFFNLADNPDFDFKPGDTEDVFGYCVFGEVIAGLEVVEQIAQLPTTAQGDFAKVPSPAVAIRSIERLR